MAESSSCRNRTGQQANDLARRHLKVDLTHGDEVAEVLVSRLSAIVDMGSAFDRAEGDAAQQILLQREGHQDDRNKEGV